MESQNMTKLVINLKEGIVQVEGDEKFVRDVYADFKERVSTPVVLNTIPANQIEHRRDETASDAASTQSKGKARRTASAPAGKGDSVNYKPKFNNELNLAGLPEFYDRYAPSGHSEKILVFAAYLRDQLKMTACSADDIFTCYFTMKSKTKIPEAFLQAFRTCQHRTHYIKYNSFSDIQVAIPGDNFLNQKPNK